MLLFINHVTDVIIYDCRNHRKAYNNKEERLVSDVKFHLVEFEIFTKISFLGI